MKKPKMIHKLIYDPVFKSETLFYNCEDPQRIKVHIKKKYKISLDFQELHESKGVCLENKCPNTNVVVWIIWVSKYKDWKTMVHEAAHLTFRVLDLRGIRYGGMDSETWCYLHEYFVSKFWHVMCKGIKK